MSEAHGHGLQQIVHKIKTIGKLRLINEKFQES